MAVRSGEKPAALWLDAEDAVVHQGLAWALDHDLLRCAGSSWTAC
jgi:hypothetical protein